MSREEVCRRPGCDKERQYGVSLCIEHWDECVARLVAESDAHLRRASARLRAIAEGRFQKHPTRAMVSLDGGSTWEDY